jgi:predicted transcriptional regulator of viral defense system
MRVASPEITVFDLLRHPGPSGGLNNIATVLAELSDRIELDELVATASLVHLTEVQRAGYLFELLERAELARALEDYLQNHQTQPSALRPDLPTDRAPISKRWKLALNVTIEPDS